MYMDIFFVQAPQLFLYAYNIIIYCVLCNYIFPYKNIASILSYNCITHITTPQTK